MNTSTPTSDPRLGTASPSKDQDQLEGEAVPSRRRGLSCFATFILSVLIALAVWTCWTWPLPRLVREAIPYGLRVTGGQVAAMVPGDQLQLLYHFWRFDDLLAGHSRWGDNFYEFNFGNDAARREAGACYYLPFSAFFTLGDRIAGRAFGWNLAGWCALWLGYGFTVRLARRYCATPGVAWVAALPALMLPYRWEALLGGSPLGFAMMWIPALWLGIDVAVRDGRLAGGLLAGVALVGACAGDLHVLAFAFLSAPVVGAVALLNRRDFRWTHLPDYLRVARALLPLLFGALAVWAMRHAATADLAASTMAAGRDPHEIINFSPNWKGLFLHRHIPVSNSIYIGYAAPACIALGAAALLFGRRAGPVRDWRLRATLLVGLVLLAGVIVLSLGPRDPLGGHFYMLMRKLVPPYAMIRQPPKIFCLMPPLLAVLLAMTLGALAARRATRAGRWALLALATLCLAADYRWQVRAGLTRLQDTQGAYAAVAEDAAARHVIPRAVIVALWPGDTHFTSIYQHLAARYRIRMVNGYSPVVSREYRDAIYPNLVSINQGLLNDAQLDDLLGRGIDHILVHEDMFPEKVSPFPVTHTLRRLLNNPRIEFLARDGAVWAFRVTDTPRARAPVGTNWTLYASARLWDAQACPHRSDDKPVEGAAGGMSAVALRSPADFIGVRPTGVVPAPQLRVLAHVRGRGVLQHEWLAGSNSLAVPPPLAVDAPAWSWLTLPAPELNAFTQLGLKLSGTAGCSIDVDQLVLTAGDWEIDPATNRPVVLPAAVYFHAGHLDPADGSVRFTRGDYAGGVWYGPKLPLVPGSYLLELDAQINAPAGAQAGLLRVTLQGEHEVAAAPVRSGARTTVILDKRDDLPFNVVFDYDGSVDVAVQRLTITRRPAP